MKRSTPVRTSIQPKVHQPEWSLLARRQRTQMIGAIMRIS